MNSTVNTSLILNTLTLWVPVGTVCTARLDI